MSGRHQPEHGADSILGLRAMALCVCGHLRKLHRQWDAGEDCTEIGCSCEEYRRTNADQWDEKRGETLGNRKTIAEAIVSLPAGVTPEGLAREKVAESVNASESPRPCRCGHPRSDHRINGHGPCQHHEATCLAYRDASESGR